MYILYDYPMMLIRGQIERSFCVGDDFGYMHLKILILLKTYFSLSNADKMIVALKTNAPTSNHIGPPPLNGGWY